MSIKNHKVNLRLLLVALAVAWLINAAALAVSESLADPAPGIVAVLDLLATVSSTVFYILALIGVAGGALALWELLAGAKLKLFEEKEAAVHEAVSVAHEADQTIEDLGHRLDDIEANRDQALLKLQDAHILAGTLVSLIRRTVAKCRDLSNEVKQLEGALDAWVGNDQVAIARAAGALNDDHIRSLLLDTNGDDGYRASVLNLIATQTGVLRSSSEALARLSNSWIEELATYRAQTARLGMVIDALDAARPLAQIESSLRLAQGYLMMQGQPELHQVTRALPINGAVRQLVDGHR